MEYGIRVYLNKKNWCKGCNWTYDLVSPRTPPIRPYSFTFLEMMPSILAIPMCEKCYQEAFRKAWFIPKPKKLSPFERLNLAKDKVVEEIESLKACWPILVALWLTFLITGIVYYLKG